MHAAAPHARSRAAFAALLALLLAAALGFAALGTWQVRRLAWKEALIARVDARIRATPAPIPGRAEWPTLTRDAAEYRRVLVQGRFDPQRQVTVTASTELGAGYWVLTPMHLDDGTVLLVNRGFVPPDQRAEAAPPAAGEVQVVGLLRWTEPAGGFLRHNDPAQGRWYSRDVQAIAAALGLPRPVAPFFVDAQAVQGEGGGWPRPGLTVVRFPNNHLGYALTWFAMAAACVAMAVYVLRDDRRPRPGAQRSDADSFAS